MARVFRAGPGLFEHLLTATLLAAVLASALMAFSLGPKVRALFHASGRALPFATRCLLAPAWWLGVLGVLLAVTAWSFYASTVRHRRALLGAGLLLGALAFTVYGAAVLPQGHW